MQVLKVNAPILVEVGIVAKKIINMFKNMDGYVE